LGTIERWAFDYIAGDRLDLKLAPPPRPARWEEVAIARRLDRPGRPAELIVVERTRRSLGPASLRPASRRAQQFHTFLHHELQAAELMLWALLAFPDAPHAFRAGLLGIFDDEIRHLQMYREHLERLGARYGDFPVRDWFWERIPQSPTPAHFVAALGIGLEGGNLDHARRYAAKLRAAGDDEGARIQEAVAEEEIAHVRFAVHWFRQMTGGLDYETWRAHLPRPLSPLLMRGEPIARAARRRAGLPDDFVDRLARYRPE